MFSSTSWNCRSKPCFKGLLKKPLKNPQNFRSKTPLYLGEAFEVPRNFSRKVSCVGVWGRCPNIQCTRKKHGVAVLFIFHDMLELRSKPCFKGLLKKPLKNPQNFRSKTPLYLGEAFEFPKDFSRKVLCVGVWGGCPNL